MNHRDTKARKAAKAPDVKGLEYLFLATGRFEDAWTFWTDIAGGKALETWGDGPQKSGLIEFAGQSIVLGGGDERAEDAELGVPVKHGLATLYFSTPDVDALYHALAGRGASIVRGPLKTHWGAKVMTVKAGDAVVAFIEAKKAKKRK